MRVFSFAQESTRYCNYSKDKFSKECTFIIPCWLELYEDIYECFEEGSDIYEFRAIGINSGIEVYGSDGADEEKVAYWLKMMDESQFNYNNLIQLGWTPQQARSVLPNSLKTELIMTGTIKQWKGFFELRCAGSAHPQARELATPLHEEFIKKGLIKEIESNFEKE